MNNKIYMFLTILIVLSFMALAETTVSRTVADDGTVIASFTELDSFGNQLDESLTEGATFVADSWGDTLCHLNDDDKKIKCSLEEKTGSITYKVQGTGTISGKISSYNPDNNPPEGTTEVFALSDETFDIPVPCKDEEYNEEVTECSATCGPGKTTTTYIKIQDLTCVADKLSITETCNLGPCDGDLEAKINLLKERISVILDLEYAPENPNDPQLEGYDYADGDKFAIVGQIAKALKDYFTPK